jgi:hypothetical protein
MALKWLKVPKDQLTLDAEGNACATGFDLKPGKDDIDGTKYYTLIANNSHGHTNIDVALEGNANTANIKDYLSLSCKWGEVEGVRIEMLSKTGDGVMVVDSYYFFNEKFINIFAKSFAVMNEKTPYIPLSLNHMVCDHEGKSVKKDSRTGRDYVEDYEVITEGPFLLKGVPNVRIKYVTGKGIDLVKESESGEFIIDTYKNKNNLSPVNLSVFFMSVYSKMNIISLMSWGKATDTHDMLCYKVYAYAYDNKGNISKNNTIINDPNLSGCERKGKYFEYKNATSVKKYLNEKFKR